MTQHDAPLRGREIIERWRSLADRRLDYLTELFESGRWRRFHTEVDLLANIQEAKDAAETWRRLATQEAASDNYPVTWSWLDRPARTTSHRHAAASHRAAGEGSEQIARASDRTTANDWQHALDAVVMQERYPILRNAM